MILPSPAALKERFPTDLFVSSAREKAIAVLQRKDPRLACIVGPCSIHDPEAALEYAKRLKELSLHLESTLFIVMRVFCEKPRTRSGWKGLLYDPALDGSNDIAQGFLRTRELLCELAKLEMPCAAEFLDPLAAPYYEDLITWGFIGARTSASPPHRQMASRLSFPVGFKNTIFGEIAPAINGILTAQEEHTYLGIDDSGRVAALKSPGNPLAHLVLRGSETGPNFDLFSVQASIERLKERGLLPRLLIDCSHGNSGKNPLLQKIALESVFQQIREGSREIAGFMLESHLVGGRQQENKIYGVSLTDSCIGWEETEELLLAAASLEPISMSSVQK